MANRYPKDARSVRSIAKELGINHKTVAALERSALAKLRRVPGFAQHLMKVGLMKKEEGTCE